MIFSRLNKILRLESIGDVDLLVPKRDIIRINYFYFPVKGENFVTQISAYNGRDILDRYEFVTEHFRYNDTITSYKILKENIVLENGCIVLVQGQCLSWHYNSSSLEYKSLNELLIKVGFRRS